MVRLVVGEALWSCNSHTQVQAVIHQQPPHPNTYLYVIRSRFSRCQNLTFHVAAHYVHSYRSMFNTL